MTFINKGKLLVTLAAFALSSLTIAAELKPVFQSQSDSLNWTDTSSLPGAKVAVLAGDPAKHQPFVARIKLPANFTIPVHAHPINEYDTVISGTLYMGAGKTMDQKNVFELTTGSFIMVPAKTYHYAFTKEETIVQTSGIGPWGMIPYKNKS